MKGYRKPSGIYIELPDDTPVANTLVSVALRPSGNHIFTDNWATAPMDAAVCWRTKGAAEVTAERDGELTAFLDSAGGRAMKALVLVGIEKGVWTMAELKAKWRLF